MYPGSGWCWWGSCDGPGRGVSKSATKALRAGIGREEKRGISTFLLARSGSIRVFVADLDSWRPPWGQVVFAPLMMSLIFSAGVCPFKTRRGRRLRRSWTAWTWASVTSVKLVPLGKYSRISPPVFSLVGR